MVAGTLIVVMVVLFWRSLGLMIWWAVQGSNLRPLPCEGNALPLS
jgi:hypothetical protein